MNKLNTRQHSLKNWLEENFVSGKWFTIEEVCEAGLGYVLNTNPRSHDKCILLSNDVKEIDWATGVERYIPIIKNSKGSIKLAESREELEEYIASEKRKVEKVCMFANHLQSLIALDGTCPIINLSNNAIELSKIKPVEVYENGN